MRTTNLSTHLRMFVTIIWPPQATFEEFYTSSVAGVTGTRVEDTVFLKYASGSVVVTSRTLFANPANAAAFASDLEFAASTVFPATYGPVRESAARTGEPRLANTLGG
eukprot:3817092-Pyramimonas_sp.AAC.2